MKVNLLDVVIKIKNERLSTDLYSKPIDSHQYLHYNSCHVEHKKIYHLHSNFEVKENLFRDKRSQVRCKGR